MHVTTDSALDRSTGDGAAVCLTRAGLREALRGRALLAPLTRAGNLPYRALCIELGAQFTFSEMAHSRGIARDRGAERVLLRHHASETRFGVQLAGRDTSELAAAARLAVEQGAQLIDFNLGCPIDSVVRKGLGAGLLQKPNRLTRLLAALREAVDVPLLMKIRTGYKEGHENAVAVARIGEDAGVDAITVHGRTREQRYRRPADWDRIAEVADAVAIPVIGNGDILTVADVHRHLRDSGCTAVMVARGALICPWLFADLVVGADRVRSSEERLVMMRRWVELALEYWGRDDHGFKRVRSFLELQVDFWRRYAPPDATPDGVVYGIQDRASFTPRDPLEAQLAAADPDGMARTCDLILEPFDPPPIALRPTTARVDSSAGGWS